MYLFIYFTYFVGLSVCLPWPEANAVFGVLALKSLETLVYNWHWVFFFLSHSCNFSQRCVCAFEYSFLTPPKKPLDTDSLK